MNKNSYNNNNPLKKRTMRISELLLWLLNQYIVIELLCPQRAELTGKLPQNHNNREMKRD